MNTTHDSETPVAAYCQNCGKPLSQEGVRSVGGVIYCEACLAARLQQPPTPGGTSTGAPIYMGLPASGAPNPGLALGLGFIPGVGAMYNGQFVKGLVHVFVFALLCTFSSHENLFGFLIPFWIAYQVFDAYQTARARRDGTPLPNPFGLNDVGYRLGLQQHPEGTVPPTAGPYTPPFTAGPGAGAPPYTPGPGYSSPGAPATEWTSYVPPQQQPGTGAASGFAPGTGPGYGPGYGPPYGQGYAPGGFPPPPPYPATRKNEIPTGAIVLIALGGVFLLGSLGIFHDDWIGRSWPLVIVGIGVWLLVRRSREMKYVAPPGTSTGSPTSTTPASTERTPL